MEAMKTSNLAVGLPFTNFNEKLASLSSLLAIYLYVDLIEVHFPGIVSEVPQMTNNLLNTNLRSTFENFSE